VKISKKGKQVKCSFEAKNIVSTSRSLEFLHLDLFGLTRTASLSGYRYALVIVDDYTRWTRVRFLTHKDESFDTFYKFYKKIKHEKGICISSIRSDHGGEFENDLLKKIYEENGIHHNFSTPRTQHNRVVKRKNRSLQEMERTMLNYHLTPKQLWTEAVNNVCYL